MAPHNYSSGPGNSAGYMASGRPWLTGSGPGHGGSTTGLHTISHGYDNGASSSFIAGMFRTDGDGTGGRPAEVYIKFPAVTKAFEIVQSGSGILRVHFRSIFDEDGDGARNSRVMAGNHFIQLDGDEESMKFNVKCKEVYISAPDQTAGFQLIAELTGIPTGSMYQMTGSGITQ